MTWSMMKAKHISILVVIMAVCLFTALILWGRGVGKPQVDPNAGSIQNLSREIQGKEPDEIRAIIIRRFGKADREVGSGMPIEQWDIGGGVLTFSGVGPFYEKDGEFTRLIRTTNLVEECLFGSYEMRTLPDQGNRGTKYWLGVVVLLADGRYRYEDSSQSKDRRDDQGENFFMLHQNGTAVVEYAEGITLKTRLEGVADDTHIATVTFTSGDGRTSKAYDIVSYASGMALVVESDEPMLFELDKNWVNYWR